MRRYSLELLAALVVVLCSALPPAHAATDKLDPIKVHVDASAIELRLASGEIVRARFESRDRVAQWAGARRHDIHI
jgi:hypothetical protein